MPRTSRLGQTRAAANRGLGTDGREMACGAQWVDDTSLRPHRTCRRHLGVGTDRLRTCGASGMAEPATAGSSGDGSSSSEDPSVDEEEQITPGGIAAIVLEHLRSDAVVEFVT